MDASRTAPRPIERTAAAQVYKNPFVTLYDDHVQFANGRAGRYWRLVNGDGYPPVVVMPVIGDHTALVRVWRYATQEWEWGFPRGYAHGPDPEVSARAELIEEIGAEPAELLRLGRTCPDSSHIETRVHMFAARMHDGAMDAAPIDTEEVAEVWWLPVSELMGLIRAGAITDGFTLSTIGAWSAWQLAG